MSEAPNIICDRCEWPMSVAEIVLNPDGTIPGMPICGQCRADIAEDLLAARQMEPVTL